MCIVDWNMIIMNTMTSSNGSIFRVSGHLCICAGNSPVQWRGALMFSLICARMNGWVNNHKAGDLRRICAHYNVIVMKSKSSESHTCARVRHFVFIWWVIPGLSCTFPNDTLWLFITHVCSVGGTAEKLVSYNESEWRKWCVIVQNHKDIQVAIDLSGNKSIRHWITRSDSCGNKQTNLPTTMLHWVHV